ncbi:endonuclease domain-containing protein [Subtercola endophyticus]|uniref:endonuclease domain-containing protein n=1 Tax=Subtercola endophyticus TaxID=2895559 RepID=UPI001E57722D|nr:DUF559 domain-containing protein [Subtercola endophyticus]UFS59857.1 endonuclease domain-containing protein [Subtercola endophyticus]
MTDHPRLPGLGAKAACFQPLPCTASYAQKGVRGHPRPEWRGTMNDMDVPSTIVRFGGVADYAALATAGASRLHVRRALDSGAVFRVRNGWFAVPGAAEELVAAVRVGGTLSCVSALRRAGIWCLDDTLLHVCVDRHAPYVASPRHRRTPLGAPSAHAVALHRGHRHRGDTPTPACETPAVALAHLFACRPRAEVVASLDSALNKKLVTAHEVCQLVDALPQKYAPYLLAVDASAQSGTETFVRLQLRRLRIAFRTQVAIEGVGRVDFVVGQRFVVEADSTAWHAGYAAFAEDRRRDLELHTLGYIVLRLSYWQVIDHLDDVVAVIRGVVARGEHLWAARHRHRGLGLASTNGGDR